MASGVRTALRGRGRGPRRCSVRAEGAVGPGAEPRGHTALPQPKRPREALGSAAVCRGSEPGEPFVAGLDPGVFSGGVRSLVFQRLQIFAPKCRPLSLSRILIRGENASSRTTAVRALPPGRIFGASRRQ